MGHVKNSVVVGTAEVYVLPNPDAEGRSERIASRAVEAMAATLDLDAAARGRRAAAAGVAVECSSTPPRRAAAWGTDGHPKRGGFLPPVPLPRRMWAGGRLQWELANPLRVGDAARRSQPVGCDPVADSTCVAAFISAFGLKAWRRPLSEAELGAMQALYDAAGLSAVVAAMLQAPQFLYRPEPPSVAAGDPAALDPYALATRLSYLVVASTPDAELLAAAADGSLSTPAGLELATEYRDVVQRALTGPRRALVVRTLEADRARQVADRLAAAQLVKISSDTAELTPSLRPAIAADSLYDSL